MPPIAYTLLRLCMAALVAFSLLAGMAGGLLRAGVPLFHGLPETWITSTASLHAALMVCCFLGTVIGIERAVALHAPWAFLSPMATALGGVFLVTGQPATSLWLFLFAALVFVVVNVFIVGRQAAMHTYLLLLSAVVWLAGNLRFMHHGLSYATLTAWLAFLVLTITAERLEMARLTRPHAWSRPLLGLGLMVLLTGVLMAERREATGCILFGAGLLALALWLMRFDIARHTIKTEGLSRYMAVCLLSGYVWLGVSGMCWMALGLGHATRDTSLHALALALGFIMSMVMAHAPVILPSLARVKLHIDARFYLPLLLLHLSLFMRLIPGHTDATWFLRGSMLNAAAIALFALTVLSAIWSWRRRHPSQIAGNRRAARTHL